MTDIREMINPHDKITLDCSDIDAARLAVLIVGLGKYCIKDDAMPLFILTGDAEAWISEHYQMDLDSFVASVDRESLCKTLKSFALEGAQSSAADPVGHAHKLAESIGIPTS